MAQLSESDKQKNEVRGAALAGVVVGLVYAIENDPGFAGEDTYEVVANRYSRLLGDIFDGEVVLAMLTADINDEMKQTVVKVMTAYDHR